MFFSKAYHLFKCTNQYLLSKFQDKCIFGHSILSSKRKLWEKEYTLQSSKFCNTYCFANLQLCHAQVMKFPLKVVDFASFWLKGRIESNQISRHANYLSVSASAANQRHLPWKPSNAQRAIAEQGSILLTAVHHLHPHRATLIKTSCLHDLGCWVYMNCLLLLLTTDFSGVIITLGKNSLQVYMFLHEKLLTARIFKWFKSVY